MSNLMLVRTRFVDDRMKSALENGAALTGKITFSVRPQSMRLSRAPSERAGKGPQVEVKVIERAYLGEYWDYVVMPAHGSTRLRVTAPPLEVYGVGESAWLELDPSQMAPIV